MTEKKESIQSLISLKDKRIAICTEWGQIKIFNPSNKYISDIEIAEAHSKVITSLCELDNGHLVSCSNDRSIKIWKIYKTHYKELYYLNNAHNDFILNLLYLPNNQIASCSYDKTIKIWNMKEPYEEFFDKNIKILKGHTDKVRSLLLVKEKNCFISGSQDQTVRMWDISNYQCINVFNKVFCGSIHALYMINDNTLLVGSDYQQIFIVDINQCKIKHIIKCESIKCVSCFVMLRDKVNILCGCDKGKCIVLNINTLKYKVVQTNHSDVVFDWLNLNNRNIISCSWDGSIRLWNY